MVAFIQKAHGCIFLYDAIEAQAAQLAISDRPPALSTIQQTITLVVVFAATAA